MSQDQRLVELVSNGAAAIVAAVRGPLERELGDPIGFVWESLSPMLSQVIAQGVLDVLGALGLETGRIKVHVAEGVGVHFVILPPKGEKPHG